MDTVYGTKKYFQSLSGASDIYRTQACRNVNNDYSYQNTLGRRSTLGAYYHMNKQPSYTNDQSLNSQYSYNTWGIWRDGRNIAPSTFSTKTHTHYQKTRSFSIILTTAAFIVLLAVISIAGLAFYFSSIKANMEDPVLGFEGSFRIAKGDLYSTGLKYNHTTTYKQKIEFYKRFVERALTDNALQPLRVDIWGFGEGPLIKVSFRTFLDVRKLPQNIHSVEEYIKESLFLETTAVKSLYRSIRIDAESVEIKRILDEQVVKTASLFKEAQTVPTSQTQLEKRLMKKGGNAPSLLAKPASTSKPLHRSTTRPHLADDEPDIDVENAPVIQGSFEGSFEITKTDADIARKKVTPTKAYTSLPPKAVTPIALRVKPRKPSIEKLTTIIPQNQNMPITATTSTTRTTTTTTAEPLTSTTTSTTTTPSTTTTTTTSSTPKPTTSASSSTTTTAVPSSSSTKRIVFSDQFTFPEITTPPTPTVTVAKSDTHLFTSIPILDTQPWKPIHREVSELIAGPPPTFPLKSLPNLNNAAVTSAQPPIFAKDIPQRRVDEIELPFISDENPSPPVPAAFNPYAPGFFGTALRKPDLSEESNSPQNMMFYHSFGNPVFMPGTDDIERLGAGAHVHPHPLPVPLLDDVVVPPFKPMVPTMGSNDKLPFEIEAADDEKFEHIGGGVIVKKNDDMLHTSSETKVESTSALAAEMSTVMVTQPTSLKVDVYEENNGSTTENPKDEQPNQVQELPNSQELPNRVQKPGTNSELADTIGEFFMGLLNLTNEDAKSTTAEPIESRVEPDDEDEVEVIMVPTTTTTSKPEIEEEADEAPTSTNKPNFLNLKELILQRNQLAKNHSKLAESFTTITTTYAPTTMPSTSTENAATTLVPLTTKRNRIRPTYHKPMDDSSLFPSHSKWEFVNSSSANNFGHTGNMRRVFNKTLQAWVSEDVEKTENFTLNDIKTRINNATNIQDISLIFDTLASKLGITPSMATKVPPFSQNKIKHQTQRNETKSKTKPSTTTTTTTTVAITKPNTALPTTPTFSTKSFTSTTKLITTTTTTSMPSTTKRFIELPLQRHEPFIKPMSSFMEDSSSEGIGAAIAVVGEAEVEVIDPIKYEEMLKSSQFAEATTAETTPQLVTLLPVRSNSGIRTYRPLDESMQRANDDVIAVSATPSAVTALAEILASAKPSSSDAANVNNNGGRSSITRKSNITQSRRFPPPEAVVKGGLKVTVK